MSYLKNLEYAAAQPQEEKANFLLIGSSGSGKTRLCGTAPGPILVHSFDPGGTKTLRAMLAQGTSKTKMFFDTSFEREDAAKPTAYKMWESCFRALSKEGVFNQIGTYVIDSGTRFIEAISNEILKQGGVGKSKSRAGEPLQLQDYQIQQLWTTRVLTELTNLPCNFIFTAHIEMTRDEVDGRMYATIHASGKLKIKLPLLFDEVLVLKNKETSAGTQRTLITSVDGKLNARTRIGAEGIFAKEEPPDIRALLKKAGYPYEDKIEEKEEKEDV